MMMLADAIKNFSAKTSTSTSFTPIADQCGFRVGNATFLKRGTKEG